MGSEKGEERKERQQRKLATCLFVMDFEMQKGRKMKFQNANFLFYKSCGAAR